MIAIPIILYLGVLAWDLVTDFRKWKYNRSINHSKEWWIRVALLFPAVTGFALLLPVHWIPAMFSASAMAAFTWWLLFDGIYNKARGFGWWFNGSLDAANQDSTLDRWLMKLKDWQEALIKIGAAAVSITIYILLLCFA